MTMPTPAGASSLVTSNVFTNGVGAISAVTLSATLMYIISLFGNYTVTVNNNAALTAIASTSYTQVTRLGFTTLNDSSPVTFASSNAACSLNSGAGDGGSQVPSSDAKCWVAKYDGQIDVKDFGAVGDGTTNDSTAFQNALNAGSALGGRVISVPATGHAYALSTGLIVGDGTRSGSSLEGTAGMYWPGPYDNTESDWTAHGSWLHCKDTFNSCISVNGNGSHVKGLSFWYTQTTPPAGTSCAGTPCAMTHNWTPTAYPYTITVAAPQNFNYLSDINIINATNCIDWEGPSTGVATIYTYMAHMHLGCFNIGTKFNRVDNAMDISDVTYTIWWYQFSSDVVGYTEGDNISQGHKIDMDMHYLANAHGQGIEFFQSYAAIRATDQSVTSGLGSVTFGAQALQFSNISFNSVCRGMILAANTTHYSGRFNNIIAAADTQTSSATQCAGLNPYFFDLESNNVDVALANVDGYFVQGLAAIGGGISGILHVVGARTESFSSFVNSTPAITVANGAALDMPNDLNGFLTTNVSAGPRISGVVNWANTSAGNDIEGAAGTVRQSRFLTTSPTGGQSTARWGLRTDNTSESGGNVGSNFGIDRYATNGAFIDTPIQINRSTGVATILDGMVVVLPISCSGQPTGTLWNNLSAVGICP